MAPCSQVLTTRRGYPQRHFTSGVGSETLNGFFVPSSPPFDVVVDSGGSHVHAEQGDVVGWRGEDGLPSEFWDLGISFIGLPSSYI